MVAGSFQGFFCELNGLSGTELDTRHALFTLVPPGRLTFVQGDVGDRADLLAYAAGIAAVRDIEGLVSGMHVSNPVCVVRFSQKFPEPGVPWIRVFLF